MHDQKENGYHSDWIEFAFGLCIHIIGHCSAVLVTDAVNMRIKGLKEVVHQEKRSLLHLGQQTGLRQIGYNVCTDM